MAKIGKFSRKYGLFLSNASNEEVVSVSKELMNGMVTEVKITLNTAIAVLATSVIALLLMISVISGASTTLVGTAKSIVFLTRIAAIALVCITTVHAVTARLRIQHLFKFYWKYVSVLALISLVLVWLGA